MKKILCLLLFLLPVLWMLITLFNHKEPTVNKEIIQMVKKDIITEDINTKNIVDVNKVVDVENIVKNEVVAETIIPEVKTNVCKNEDLVCLNTDKWFFYSQKEWVSCVDWNLGKECILDDGWLMKNLNWNDVKYKLWNSFEKCSVVDNLVKSRLTRNSTDKKLFDESEWITRSDFLEVILTAHCIEYVNEDPSSLNFTDLNNKSEIAKAVKKAIDLGIARWYDNWNWGKKFRASEKIEKIEALAILLNLSKLELKNNTRKINFADVNIDWKRNIANMSYVLGITKVDTVNKKFFPNMFVTNKGLSDILYNIAPYYRK